MESFLALQPDGTYVMMGDNKERIDSWLPSHENVLGEVVLRVPFAGRVIQNGGPLVFGMVDGLLVTLAIFWQDPGKAAMGEDRPESPAAPVLLRPSTGVSRVGHNQAA